MYMNVGVIANRNNNLIMHVVVLYCVAGSPTAPMITTLPMEQNVSYEGQATFECLSTGVPDPVYRWFKNGKLISGQNLPTLYFPDVQVSDRGLYSCAVTNSEGSDESQQVYLRITGTLNIAGTIDICSRMANVVSLQLCNIYRLLSMFMCCVLTLYCTGCNVLFIISRLSLGCIHEV